MKVDKVHEVLGFVNYVIQNPKQLFDYPLKSSTRDHRLETIFELIRHYPRMDKVLLVKFRDILPFHSLERI